MNRAEYERAVIAGVKYNNELYDTIGLIPADFGDDRLSQLYTIIGEIIESGRKADDLAIVEAIEAKKSTVPASYVAELEAVPRGNVEYYAQAVKEAALKGKLATLFLEAQDGIEEKHSSVILEIIEKFLVDISAGHVHEVQTLGAILHPAMQELERVREAKGGYTGIPTGFALIDYNTRGLQGGELIVIGARPSIGKTALALCMALNMAQAGTKVGFFSLEMSRKSLGVRIIANRGRINLQSVASPSFDGWDRLNQTCTGLYDMPLLIDDTPNARLRDIRSKARWMYRQGVRIIFVDYLTLIRHGDMKLARHERVGDISKQLKHLARELDIPVVALSQVGRQAEDSMPTLADLRQSGEIEEDSDVIIFLHRERTTETGITEVYIAKNRNGPVGAFRLTFFPAYARFDNTVEG